MDFQGKRVVITGVSRGVGLAAAKLLLKAGADVFGTARDAQRLEKASGELKALGPFKAFAADLSEADAPKRVAEAASRHWGAVDLLVNNAAVLVRSKDWMAEGADTLEQHLRVNLLAPHALILHLLSVLRNGDEPRVINVSSSAGIRQSMVDASDMPSYRLSKYAINGLTILWSGTLKGEVAVNSLDPGWLKTDMGGPEAPGEAEDGAKRLLALAGMPFEVTGKFFRGGEELPF